MNGTHYIGKRVSSFEAYNDVGPITGIALVVDSDNEYLAGDQNGYVLEVQCPYGTQDMANNILASISGHVYRGYRAENAILTPTAELGDGVTVNGVYSMLAYRKVNFGPGHMSEISAPGENDVDHEYPYISSTQREINRQLAQTRSQITKTAEQIRLEVADEAADLSASFTVELGKISARVDDAEQSVEVALTTLDGLTVTDSTGTTKIKGSSVETGTLYVSAANINGTLTANQINLTGSISWSDLASDAKNQVTSAQAAASSALSTANSAASTAASASSKVSAWTYGSTTYIDGTQLMTGTVTATKLQGGSVSILTSSGATAGTMTVNSASSVDTYAIDLTSNAAMRLQASSGALYLRGGSGENIMLYNGNITVSNTFRPTQDNLCQCGTSAYRWQIVYAASGTATTSDRNEKHDIEPLPEKYLAMLLELPTYRFKLDGGTSDRYHSGYIAQDVEEYMDKHNIDSSEFGGFIKDVDEDGNDIYMLRYEEFIAIHTMAIQRIYQKLEAAGI